MLSGRPADANAALHNPVDFTKSLVNTALLIITLDITKRGLIRQRSDRTRPKRLSGSKNNFRIFVRFTLIIS